MIEDREIRKVKELVTNTNKFIECRKRIEEHEPILMRWIAESAQTVAMEEAGKLVETAQSQSGSYLFENILSRIRSRFISCIIAGFLASEVYHSSKWSEDLGIDGATVQEKKLKAFMDGSLPSKYYEGIDGKTNALIKHALDNFKKKEEARKQANEVVDHLAKTDGDEDA